MKDIKVNLTNSKNNFNINHRRENYFNSQKTIICFDPKTEKFIEALIVRFYKTKNLSFCCFWLETNNKTIRGTAKANGYKCHAFQKALTNSNIILSDSDNKIVDIGGVGTSAIEDIMFIIVNSIDEYSTLPKYLQTAHG